MSAALTRKTFNLNVRATAALEELTTAFASNETDAVNRALTLAAVLLQYMDDGHLLLNVDGEDVRLILL